MGLVIEFSHVPRAVYLAGHGVGMVVAGREIERKCIGVTRDPLTIGSFSATSTPPIAIVGAFSGMFRD